MQSRSTASRDGARPQAVRPFQYRAIVSAAGEVREIVESIGRRQMRLLDPRGREGRELLRRGEVRLWCEPLASGERVPLPDLLRALREAAERERSAHPGDAIWERRCDARLASIGRWQSEYAGDPPGH